MKISDALLPEFDQELATTRKCLARIPEDKFTFKPHPKSFDMISLSTSPRSAASPMCPRQ